MDMYGNSICSDVSVASRLLVGILSYIFLCMVLGSLLISVYGIGKVIFQWGVWDIECLLGV